MNIIISYHFHTLGLGIPYILPNHRTYPLPCIPMSYPPSDSWGSYSKGCWSVTFVDPSSFDGIISHFNRMNCRSSCDLGISGVLLMRTVLRPPPFLPHEGGVYSVARVNLTSPGHPHRGALLCTFRFGKRTGTVRLSHCPEGVVLEQSYRFRRR